ncbi:MAG TPA: EAL domain-containing response regulator [Candidatus Binatia bacterium]|nr:EAL domain-containing response regulator [Candidatus Binatia bacterium]
MSTASAVATGAERPRLLVVDDESDMCRFVAEVASQSGYAPVCASTPHEVRQQLTQQFAVVVLDLDMPGMDGVETMRVLASRQSAMRLILMSGHDTEIIDSARRIAASHGLPVCGSLTKPVRAATLSKVLGRGEGLPERTRSGSAISIDDLEQALRERQFVLHYQPQLSAAGKCIGVEALARWQRPGHGLLPPDRFIPHVEGAGLALRLTEQLTEVAFEDCAGLERRKRSAGRVSVNIPPPALHHAAFPDDVTSLSDRLGWPRDRLCFEITESSVALEPAAASTMLERLRAIGCRIALDDFGTGHSSLVLLGTLPLNEMKIDKTFILAALHDRTARAVVENSVKLGKELGLDVVAEGVETAEQWEWVRRLGCDAAQGFHLARPMPAEALAEWLARN